MNGVVKLVPVARAVPPVEAEYHEITPLDAVAPSVTVPDPQIAAGVVAVIVGCVLTVAKTAERDEVHVPSLVST